MTITKSISIFENITVEDIAMHNGLGDYSIEFVYTNCRAINTCFSELSLSCTYALLMSEPEHPVLVNTEHDFARLTS
jgi:hypothetical protein